MVLIDSNVFMYAGGSDHPHRAPSLAYLERVAAGEVEAAIDVEVLQEILHRYRAIGRWEDGRRVYDLARRIVPLILPLTADALDAARELMDRHPGLPARDAVHAAVAEANGIVNIVSWDRHFDGVEGIRRVEP